MPKTTPATNAGGTKQTKNSKKKQPKIIVKKTNSGRQQARYRARSRAYKVSKNMSRTTTSGSVRNSSWDPQSSLTIPTNTTTLKGMVKAYELALADPLRYSSRIPDGYADDTGIFRSVSAFNLPVTFAGTAATDDGRFSFLVQPIMGSLTSPSQYQIAAVDCSKLTAWDNTVNFASSNYFLTNSNGSDVRLDPNLRYMAGGLSSYFDCGFTAGTTVSDLINSGPTPDVTNTAAYQTVLSGGVSYIILPSGTYEVALQASWTSATAIPTRLGASFTGNLTTATIVNSFSPLNTPNAATAGSSSWIGTVTASGTNNQLSFSIVNTDSITPSTTAAQGTTRLIITPTQPSNVSYTSQGAIESLRPVGMSVLATYVGSTLDDGGQIAIGQYDADYISSNFFSQASPSGQAQKYENLQRIGHTFTGRLSKGVYCWWRPRSADDSRFRTISQSNANAFPGIICSGQVTRPDGLSAAATESVLRIIVCHSYEFSTSSTAFDVRSCVGSQNHVDTALAKMAHQPRAQENPKHLSWIESLLHDAGEFIDDNKGWIGPAIATGLSFL